MEEFEREYEHNMAKGWRKSRQDLIEFENRTFLIELIFGVVSLFITLPLMAAIITLAYRYAST